MSLTLLALQAFGFAIFSIRLRIHYCLSLVLLWWLGFGYLSNLSKPSFPYSSFDLVFSLLLFSCSALLGSLAVRQYFEKRVGLLMQGVEGGEDRLIGLISIPIVIVASLLVFISIYGFVKIRSIVGVESLSPSVLRIYFYKMSANGGSVWLPSKIGYSLLLIVSGFLIHFLTVLSIPLLITKKKYWPLFVFTVLAFAETFSRAARGPIYSVIIVSIILVPTIMEKSSSLIKKLFIFSCFLSLSALLAISFIRESSILKSTFQYHQLGPVFLSSMMNSSERLPFGGGRYTLGGADYILSMVIRGLGDKSFSTPVRDNVKYQSQPRFLKDELPNNPRLVHYNAFYTMFSSVYLDFGFLGFALLGLLIGSSSTFFHLRFLSTGSSLDLIWLVFITYNSMMGLFGVTLETPSFWLTFISLVFLTQFKKRQYV